MKIMLVESCLTGHHKTYLDSLVETLEKEDEAVIVVPEAASFESKAEHCVKIVPFMQGKNSKYIEWIDTVYEIVKQYEPDVLHFVYGDDLYRYFGIGLIKIQKKCHIVITCHQIRRSFLRDWSIRRMSKLSSALVVHTEKLKKDLVELGAQRVVHIEYPQFNHADPIESAEAKRLLGLDKHVPVMLALGGTREDKGIDLLLEALKNEKEAFQLIIAGKEEYFSREFIEKETSTYKDHVTLMLRFLSDDELNLCLNAADILVLPYRISFDGASGPLGEGVWLRKEIVGPAHGSLGHLIQNNHLGMVFESENTNDLARVLNECLRRNSLGQEQWKTDELYESYRNKLDTTTFMREYRDLYHLAGEKK